MGDTWEYRAIWELAGMDPPNYHEDELEAIADGLATLSRAIFAGSNEVTGALHDLGSSISSESFDTLSRRWTEKGKVATVALAETLENTSSALYEALAEIQEWKLRIFISLGMSEAVMLPVSAVRFGAGFALKEAGINIGKAELQRMLSNLVDQLESHLVSMVIDGTPLKGLQGRIADEIQAMVEGAISNVGEAAGSYVGS